MKEIKYKGKTYKSLKAVWDKYGEVAYPNFTAKYATTGDLERSLKKFDTSFTYKGKLYKTDKEFCEAFNLDPKVFSKRKRSGYSLEQQILGKGVKRVKKEIALGIRPESDLKKWSSFQAKMQRLHITDYEKEFF